MNKRILVLFGGKSVEHDISIITFMQVLRSLPNEYKYVYVYIDKNGKWWTAENMEDIKIYKNFSKLAKKKEQLTFVFGENVLLTKKRIKYSKKMVVDGVLNCCHGAFGEDGSVQGILKNCNVAQSSTSVLSSSICMDKSFMKEVLKANNILNPKGEHIYKYEYKQDMPKYIELLEKKLDYPMIVKPSNLGSSIGITYCNDRESLVDAIDLAFNFDKKILIEKVVENLKEFNCACFTYKGNVFSSSVNEVCNKNDFFSFEDKYLNTELKSSNAESRLSKKIKELTEKVYKIFECSGIVRVDFLYDSLNKKLYVNEINTIPGALALYLFKGIKHRDLLYSVLEESFLNFDEESKLIRSFESSVLDNFDCENFCNKK